MFNPTSLSHTGRAPVLFLMLKMIDTETSDKAQTRTGFDGINKECDLVCTHSSIPQGGRSILRRVSTQLFCSAVFFFVMCVMNLFRFISLRALALADFPGSLSLTKATTLRPPPSLRTPASSRIPEDRERRYHLAPVIIAQPTPREICKVIDHDLHDPESLTHGQSYNKECKSALYCRHLCSFVHLPPLCSWCELFYVLLLCNCMTKFICSMLYITIHSRQGTIKSLLTLHPFVMPGGYKY